MHKLLTLGLAGLFLVVTGCQDTNTTGPLAGPNFDEVGDDHDDDDDDDEDDDDEDDDEDDDDLEEVVVSTLTPSGATSGTRVTGGSWAGQSFTVPAAVALLTNFTLNLGTFLGNPDNVEVLLILQRWAAQPVTGMPTPATSTVFSYLRFCYFR